MLIDILGHVAYLLIGGGILALTRKKAWGWILRFLGEAMWVGLGFALGLTSIWIWGFIFMGMDAYGYYQWRKDEA